MPPPRLNWMLSCLSRHRHSSEILLNCAPSFYRSSSSTSTANNPSPKRWFSLRPYFYVLLFGSLGYTAGKFVVYTIRPPAFPQPGSKEDSQLLRQLSHDVDSLQIVQRLRAKTQTQLNINESLHTDVPISNQDNDCDSELIEIVDPLSLSTFTGPSHGKRLLSQMTGLKGLGVTRTFWNPAARELISVLWIGGALAGWPGIAHGGVLATIFHEIGSAAMHLDRITASKKEAGEKSFRDPDSLTLTYLRPTNTDSFHIVRAKVVAEEEESAKPEMALEPGKDLVERRTRDDGRVRVNYTLEGLDGRVHVKATPAWESLPATEEKAMAKAKKSWW